MYHTTVRGGQEGMLIITDVSILCLFFAYINIIYAYAYINI